MNQFTRRSFLRTAGAASAGAWAAAHGVECAMAGIPRMAESQKLRVAVIAVGGIGGRNTKWAFDHGCECPCFAEVDTRRVENVKKHWPDAKGYQDYRAMFEKEAKNFDAVMVSTPDHHHYPATLIAMQLGKHVYTEKPLTHTIWEARQLLRAYEKYPKVVTQMGNQGHANEGNRLIVEWIQQGAIGTVKEAHCWTNRPVWPQPVQTPEGEDPVPAELDWDVWIGPAPMRKFKTRGDEKHDVYHPFSWRGWWDFGGGALADMACHTMDCVYWAMDPPAPTEVEVVECGPMPEGNFPASSKLRFHFPARGAQPAFDFFWYDGGLMPDKPAHLEEGRDLPKTGALFIGDKASLLSAGDVGNSPRLIPEAYMQQWGKPKRTIKRSPGHFTEWHMACRGEQPREFARSNFSYSAPFSELVLLGNLALRAGKGRTFGWDSKNMKIVGMPELQQFVDKTYRAGWEFRSI